VRDTPRRRSPLLPVVRVRLRQGMPKGGACEWRFTLSGVPEASTFFFRLGGRTIQTSTPAELQGASMTVYWIEDAAQPPADLNF